jgi:hypothetical protein
MPKYFVLTGLPKSGTTWLSYTLNRHDDACVVHEAFRLEDWRLRYKEWKSNPDPVVGTVSWIAQYYVDFIEEDIHPQWGIVLRNPAEVIRSNCAIGGSTPLTVNTMQALKRGALESAVRSATIFWFGALETILNQLSSVNVSAWYLEHFKSKKGFLELSEHFGLKFTNDFELPEPVRITNASVRQRMKEVSDWEGDLVEFIFKTIRSLPRVNKAYEEALDRMDSSLDEIREKLG